MADQDYLADHVTLATKFPGSSWFRCNTVSRQSLADAAGIKATFDLGTSILTQAAFVELLRTGAFDRHLRRSRLAYRTKRRHVAGLTGRNDARGNGQRARRRLNICLRLDGVVDDQQLADELKDAGVRCEALSHYQQRPNPQQGLVVDVIAAADHDLALIASTTRSSAAKNR